MLANLLKTDLVLHCCTEITSHSTGQYFLTMYFTVTIRETLRESTKCSLKCTFHADWIIRSVNLIVSSATDYRLFRYFIEHFCVFSELFLVKIPSQNTYQIWININKNLAEAEYDQPLIHLIRNSLCDWLDIRWLPNNYLRYYIILLQSRRLVS